MTESHDPWEDARQRQREQVQAIFAARTAEPVTERRRDFRLSRRNTGLVALAVLALLIAAGIAIPNWRDSAAEQRAQERARQARIVAAERARITRLERPRFGVGPERRAGETEVAYRARLVLTGADLITADARRHMTAGDISGPVEGTECVPFPTTASRRAEEADLSVPANRYECMAYERHFPLSELEGRARTGVIGQPYWLVVHYGTAKLAYCLLVPRAGENNNPLAFVRVADACSDPRSSSRRP